MALDSKTCKPILSNITLADLCELYKALSCIEAHCIILRDRQHDRLLARYKLRSRVTLSNLVPIIY
jgi:hypothetical protein